MVKSWFTQLTCWDPLKPRYDIFSAFFSRAYQYSDLVILLTNLIFIHGQLFGIIRVHQRIYNVKHILNNNSRIVICVLNPYFSRTWCTMGNIFNIAFTRNYFTTSSLYFVLKSNIETAEIVCATLSVTYIDTVVACLKKPCKVFKLYEFRTQIRLICVLWIHMILWRFTYLHIKIMVIINMCIFAGEQDDLELKWNTMSYISFLDKNI